MLMAASPPVLTSGGGGSVVSQTGMTATQTQQHPPFSSGARRLGLQRSNLSSLSGFLSLGDVRYVAAPDFRVSSLQSTEGPLPHVSLIKVPPFVAAAWRASEPHELLGVIYGDNNRKRIYCRSLKSGISTDGTGNDDRHDIYGSNIKDSGNQKYMSDSTSSSPHQHHGGTHTRDHSSYDNTTTSTSSTTRRGKSTCTTMPHAPAPLCELQCAAIKKNNHLLVLRQQPPFLRSHDKSDEQRHDKESNSSRRSSDVSSCTIINSVNHASGTSATAPGEEEVKEKAICSAATSTNEDASSAAADVLCAVEETYNFVPRLDQKYYDFLRQRHECVNVHKTRTTIEEKRREAGLDSTATLFHFYHPTKASAAGAVNDDDREFGSLLNYGSRSAAVSAEKARSLKSKKPQVTMDEDSLKVQLFQAFETAGAAGLQLKQIAQYTQQPLTFLRSVVEEIAEPRKRASDRKTVYFVKDQYNPYACVLLPYHQTRL